MASVFSFGLKTIGVGSVVQVFGAPALAVVAVLALRLLSGRKDPSEPVRVALADALADGAGPAQEAATRLWFDDGPRRWTTAVLNGIHRYRTAAEVLASRRRLLTGPLGKDIDQLLAAAHAEAQRLAEALRPAQPPTPLPPVRRWESGASALPGATRELVSSMWQGLELIQAATADRDASPAQLPPGLGRGWLTNELRGAFNWRSEQLRHAIRCALGMLVALVVASFRPTDPFVVAFLLATFAIMQPQWRDTLTKAWQRVAGALAGATALALMIWLLEVPQAVLLPIGIAALLVGFYFMQSQPIVGNGCMVFMSVAVNSTTRHADLRSAVLEYLGLMLLTAAIGLLFGFAAVPGVRKPGLDERFEEAVEAVRELLREVASAMHYRTVDKRAISRRLRAASNKQQNLLAPSAGTEAPSERERTAIEQGADGLRSLTTTAAALPRRPQTGGPLAGAIGEVARQLGPSAEPAPGLVRSLLPTGADGEQRLLVDAMVADILAVHQASAALRRPAQPVSGR
jgi:uncharacterized membrane protein YccC